LDSQLSRRLFPESSHWGTAGVFSSRAPVEVEAICGACILMRSETFRKVGGFSPEYFMYAEDMDLCAKVRRSGLKVFHVPSAAVLHHGGRSSGGSFSESSSIIMCESVHRFIQNHQGNLAALCYRLLMVLSAVVRIVLLACACAFATLLRRTSPRPSLRKWTGILAWSTGAARAQRDPLLQRQRGLNPTCVASPAK
jgi:GT2 family glycosyltransferase